MVTRYYPHFFPILHIQSASETGKALKFSGSWRKSLWACKDEYELQNRN
jgi:hypothetical protein